MSRDDGHSALRDDKEKYESVVLDFLDKEMAAVQPKKKKEHTEELDALVTGLLQQVISETDQPKTIQPATFNEKETMLSEFPSSEKTSGSSAKAKNEPAAPKAAASAPSPSPSKPQAVKKPEKKVAAVAAATPSAKPAAAKPAVFGAPAAQKNKTPMIAAAAGVLVLLGIGGYFFMSRSSETPSTAGPAPVSVPAAPQAVPTQTEAAASLPANTEPAKASPAAVKTASTRTAAAPAKPKDAASKTEVSPSTPVTSVVSTEPAKPAAAAAVPEPPKNEKPNLIKSTEQMASASKKDVIGGLIPTSAPSQALPAIPKPAAPAKKAAPQVSGNLIPARPISRVSPKYPPLAAQSRMSALVELDIVINNKGQVIEATPVSGPAIFHKEAVEAALRWRYRPASLGGVNVQSQARISMNFKLK